MGILRLLLSVSVLMTHSTPIFGYYFLSGKIAVRVFFIISGFYMSLILEKKYQIDHNGYWLFISNRLLRLLPCYYLCLLLATMLQIAGTVHYHRPFDRFELWCQLLLDHHRIDFMLIILSHLSMLGLDWLSMIQHGPSGFVWPGQPGAVDSAETWRYLMLPQSWTLSVELGFYALVPFINRWSTRWLVYMASLSFLSLFIGQQIWQSKEYEALFYYTSPFQFGYFLLGMIVYRCRAPFRQILAPGRSWWLVLCAIFAILYNACTLIQRSPLSVWLLLCSICLCLPEIFELSKNADWDRAIGNLSYPVYLVHEPVKWILMALMGVGTRTEAAVPVGFIPLLLVSLAFAVIIDRLLDRPIDEWRQSRIHSYT